MATGGQIDPISAWAAEVSEEYLSKRTLSFLKFCFEGDENVVLERVLQVKHFDDLVTYARFQRYNGNTEAALSRLIFLLDHVSGHRNYGQRSTALLKKHGIDKPEKYKENSEPRIVQLHYCLAAIASRLSLDHEDSMRNCFAGRLKINSKSPAMKTFISMFRYLVRKQIVTEENQKELVEVLYNVRAKRLLCYLKNYRIQNGLPMDEYSKLEEAETRSRSSHTSPQSSDLSNDHDSDIDDEMTAKWVLTSQTMKSGDGNTLPVDIEDIPGDSPTSTLRSGQVTSVRVRPSHHNIVSGRRGGQRADGNTTPEAVGEGLEHSSPNPSENDPLIPTPPARSGGRCAWVCTISLAVLAVLLIVGIAGSVYGTVNAATHQYSHQSVLVYGKSTVPLIDNLLPYYLSAMDLTQIDKQNLHVIDLYLVDSPCTQLNITNTTSQTLSIDQPHIENIIGWYLLPGTKIEYNICALTNVSRIEHEVIVEAYLLDNLDAVWDTVVHPSGISSGVKISEHFACYESDSNPCKCWSVSYQVKRASYYSLLFTINNPLLFPNMTYNYSRSVTTFTYSTPSQEHTLHQCQLTDTVIDAHCMFLFNDSFVHQPINMNEKLCLLADVHGVRVPPHEQTIKKQFSQMDIAYTVYSTNWLVVCVAILAVLVLVLVVVGVVEGYVCVRTCKKHSIASTRCSV